jgi:hypothetical protein
VGDHRRPTAFRRSIEDRDRRADREGRAAGHLDPRFAGAGPEQGAGAALPRFARRRPFELRQRAGRDVVEVQLAVFVEFEDQGLQRRRLVTVDRVDPDDAAEAGRKGAVFGDRARLEFGGGRDLEVADLGRDRGGDGGAGERGRDGRDREQRCPLPPQVRPPCSV